MSDPMSRLETLKQRLRSPEVAAFCDRLDAEAKVPAHIPSPPPNWLADPFGPDPFGQDWAWTKPNQRQETSELPVPFANELAELRRPDRNRRMIYSVAAVLAASVLFAVGVFIGQRERDDGSREVAFAARVSAQEDPVRGPGTVAGVAVTNQVARKAYLTIVGLSAERRPAIHYREEQRFISVAPNGSREVRNLPAAFDGCPVAIVVLTATPAGEVIRGLSTDPTSPKDAERFRDEIKSKLIDSGYGGVAVEIVRIP